MAEQQEPITLEQAGVKFGGAGKPWSRKTVERLIAAGLLFDYGYGATRRVLLRDVERLIDQFATGEASWPPRRSSPKSAETPAADRSTNRQKVQGAGSRRSESKNTKSPSDAAPLVSKPPMRSLKLLKN